MKKVLIIFFVFVLLLAAPVLLLPKLIPMETIAAKVKEQVKTATGRDLNFTDATLMVWPDLGVEMTGVTLSNAAWAKEKNMLTLDKINVALAIQPLLNRQVEIKRFILDAPVINLEIAPNGSRSWDFSKDAPAIPDTEDTAPVKVSAEKGLEFKFGQSKISNGSLTFINGQDGKTYRVQDMDMTTTLPDLKSELKLKGSLTYNGKPVDVAVVIRNVDEFIKGNASPGSIDAKTPDIVVKAAGSLATQGEMLNGHVETEISSLSKFLAWVGNGKEEKMPFEKVTFASAVSASKSDLILKGADLTLDEVHAKGNMNIRFASKPDIFARLSVNKLNLDRFKSGGAAGSDAAATEAPKTTGEDWDSKAIDLSGLRAVNADLELKADGYIVNGVAVGPSTLTVTIQDSTLRFKSSEASLFEGKFSSDLTVKASSPATMAFTFNMSGVQAKPVLTKFADFSKLSGTTKADVSVTSTGNSQKALINNLAGKGSVTFSNGTLEGIDLVNIAQMVQKRLANFNVGDGKTNFVELGGTFDISKGVATNNDLKMIGPLLKVTGKGSINLPQKSLNFHVIPTLTASAATTGKGLAVPVDIRGPFSNIKITPDFAGIVQGVMQDPHALRDTIRGVKGDTKGQLKTLKQDFKQDPGKALQNLFGGGLLGKPQAEPAETAPAPVPDAMPAPAPVETIPGP